MSSNRLRLVVTGLALSSLTGELFWSSAILAHAASLGDARWQGAQLPASHRGVEVAHAVVEPDLLVLVPRHGSTRLRGAVTHLLHQLLVVGHHGATAARGDDLVAVETEDRHAAGSAC